MKIAVVSVGGVRAYFGSRLALAGHDAAFVARGSHLAAIREPGRVKSYDTEETASRLRPLLRSDTAVVS